MTAFFSASSFYFLSFLFFNVAYACTRVYKVGNMVYDFRTLFTLNLFQFYSGICIGTAAQNHKLAKYAREHLNWMCCAIEGVLTVHGCDTHTYKYAPTHTHTGIWNPHTNQHNKIENGRNGTKRNCNSQLWLLCCRTVRILFSYSYWATSNAWHNHRIEAPKCVETRNSGQHITAALAIAHQQSPFDFMYSFECAFWL